MDNKYSDSDCVLLGQAQQQLAIPSRDKSIRAYFIAQMDLHQAKAAKYGELLALVDQHPQIITALEYIRSL